MNLYALQDEFDAERRRAAMLARARAFGPTARRDLLVLPPLLAGLTLLIPALAAISRGMAA